MSDPTNRGITVMRLALTRVAAGASIVLLATMFLTFPAAERASGATFTVSDEAGFRAALITAASNGQADVITLGADFTWSGSSAVASVNDGFDLEIDGAGHTITGSGTPADLVDFNGASSANLSIHDLTIKDFSAGLAVISATTTGAVTLTNVTTDNVVGGDGTIVLAGQPITIADSSFTDTSTTAPSAGGVIDAFPNTSFTISGSTFTGDHSAGSGGAVWVHGASTTTISGSTFSNNYADASGADGGAVYSDGEVDVDGNSVFENNSAQDTGGAIYAGYAAYIDDATFTGNASTNLGGGSTSAGGAVYGDTFVYVGTHSGGATFSGNHAYGDGGAIYAGGLVQVSGSSFDTNASSNANGGAIYATGATTANTSSFDGNHADTAGAAGGAIYAGDAATVTSSSLTDNAAGGYGGAVYSGANTVTITSSTFDGNESLYTAGGAVFAYGTVNVTGSTLTNNTAVDAGGALLVLENVSATNSTFVGNTSTTSVGGAIAATLAVNALYSTFVGNTSNTAGDAVYSNGDTITTEGSVFYTSGSSSLCNTDGTPVSNGYNFDYDGSCTHSWAGTGDLGSGADPQLGALADNGGPTLTMLPATTSPLIDVVPSGSCSVSEDQRGMPRNSFSVTGTGCDIGAVEYNAPLEFDITTDADPIHISVLNGLDWDCPGWSAIGSYAYTPPAGVSIPYGVTTFCILLPANGWTATVTLDYPGPVNQVWKHPDGAGSWAQVTGVTYAGTTVTYQVTDGGPFDEDGSVDGEFLDPVAGGIGASFTG